MLFSTRLFVYNARNSLSRSSNSTKIVVRWGFAPDPTGELTALPQTLSWIQGALLLREGEGKGREGTC